MTYLSNMDETRTANYWLLITALNTAKFAIVELAAVNRELEKNT